MFYQKIDDDISNLIIYPNDTFMLTWSLLILAIISFLIFYIPYDLSFEGPTEFNY